MKMSADAVADGAAATGDHRLELRVEQYLVCLCLCQRFADYVAMLAKLMKCQCYDCVPWVWVLETQSLADHLDHLCVGNDDLLAVLDSPTNSPSSVDYDVHAGSFAAPPGTHPEQQKISRQWPNSCRLSPPFGHEKNKEAFM